MTRKRVTYNDDNEGDRNDMDLSLAVTSPNPTISPRQSQHPQQVSRVVTSGDTRGNCILTCVMLMVTAPHSLPVMM